MMTFLQLAERVLTETQHAMDAQEIWQYAQRQGFASEVTTVSATPWHTIGAALYVNIRDKGDASVFDKTKESPVRFFIKSTHKQAVSRTVTATAVTPAPISTPETSKRSSLFLSTTIRISAEHADPDGYVVIVNKHSNHVRGLNGFDPNAQIDGLEYALKHMIPAKARILWKTLLDHIHLVQGTIETSRHSTYASSQKTEVRSTMGEACSQVAWLPDEIGRLHRPSELRLVDLPTDFDTSSHRAKELALKLGMSHPEEEQVAATMGVPVEVLAALINAYKRNPEIIEQITAKQRQTEFPIATVPYSDRRGEKGIEEGRDAPTKVYEQRQRSIRVSDGGVRNEAKTYLRDYYTNRDGKMVCQICEEEMPFKLDNGEYYFEAVQCLKEVESELKANFLALCPLCAAKYNYANGSSARSLLEAIRCANGIRIRVVLAREPETIHFHDYHIKDLQHALKGITS